LLIKVEVGVEVVGGRGRGRGGEGEEGSAGEDGGEFDSDSWTKAADGKPDGGRMTLTLAGLSWTRRMRRSRIAMTASSPFLASFFANMRPSQVVNER